MVYVGKKGIVFVKTITKELNVRFTLIQKDQIIMKVIKKLKGSF